MTDDSHLPWVMPLGDDQWCTVTSSAICEGDTVVISGTTMDGRYTVTKAPDPMERRNPLEPQRFEMRREETDRV